MSKVAFLALWFLPQVGGMEMSSYEIVQSIIHSGNDIVVATSDHASAKEFDEKQGFKIIRSKGVYLSNLASKNQIIRLYYYVHYYFAYYKLVKYIIDTCKPDELIVADEQTRNWYGFFSRFIKYNPIVIASMPEKADQRIKVKIVRRTLDAAKAIFCVSKSTQEKMCDTFGEQYKSKMSILYRTVNDDLLYKPCDIRKIDEIKDKYALHGKTVILSVCRLNPKKGLDTLIHAISLINNEDIVALIVGEGPDKDRLDCLIKQLGLLNRVKFAGRIAKDEIIHYYDACDLFVLPSEEESFGRVFVEASARHKASIGCNVGGVPEVIAHNQTGLLISPGDKSELAKSITKILNDSSFKHLMEDRAYQEVVKRFSFSMLTNFWKEYLK